MIGLRERTKNLEEQEYALGTLTSPQLEPVARKAGVSSPAQDSSITVIENPLLDGCTGFLMARHFAEGIGGVYLQDILHLRVDGDNKIQDLKNYTNVMMQKGWDFGQPYNFITADQELLQAPSIMPYSICFIESPEYERLYEELRMTGYSKDALRMMYELVARSAPEFHMDNDRLVVPENYASFRLIK